MLKYYISNHRKDLIDEVKGNLFDQQNTFSLNYFMQIKILIKI